MRSLIAVLLFTAFATVAAAQEADLAVTKTGPDQAAAGTDVSYDVTILNGGPNDASFVTLSDPIPAGMTFVSATQNSGPTFTCDSSISCTIATMPAGTSANFTFVLNIDSQTPPGTFFLNVATATSETPDPNSENDVGVAGTSTPPPPSADLALTKSGPGNAPPDSDVTFTIALVNSGPDAATTVALTDNLPAPLTFVSFTQTSGPTFSCGTSTCTLASFPAGATATFELVGHVPAGTPSGTSITNTATVTSDSDPNQENNVSSTTLTVSSVDVSVVKSGPATVTAGTNISYTITATNAGPDTAASLTLSDTLPAGTTFVSLTNDSGPAATCTTPAPGSTGTVSCKWAPFGPASSQYTLVLAVGNATSLTNTVTVAAPDNYDTNPGNNSSTVVTAVTQSADLSLTKSAPASVTAGTSFTYSLSLANNGPTTATSVSLSDALPAGTTFVSVNQTTGPAFNCSGGATVTCTIASFAPGASATFDVVVALSPSATGTVSNTATVSTATPDPNTSNNSSTAASQVTASADLTVVKSGPASVTPTSNVTWTVTLTNAGPSDAQNVTLTDTVPAGTTFVSWTQTSGPVFSCSGTGTVTCTIATFADGASATFELVATLPLNATGSVANTATASSTTSDPAPTNNSSTATSTIGSAPADVGVTKSVNPQIMVIGGTVTYTVVVSNQGPGSASSVVVTDPIPAGTELVGAPVTTQGTCTGTTTLTCNVGTLAAGGSATITFAVRILTTGNLANTATVASAEPDPNPSNGAATVNMEAVARAQGIPTLDPWALALLALALAAVMLLRSR